MSRKALEDCNYEQIKAHVLYPDESPLSDEKREILDRVISISKILDKNPLQKHAVMLHQQKYPDISRSQAYEDMRLAIRLFNSIHTFDYDFWHMWLINDIVRNIQRCEQKNDPNYRRVIAMEHANLIKAIGEKPDEMPDPRRNEKHQFYILIQNDNRQVKLDISKLKDIPDEILHQLNKAVYGGSEIDDNEAEAIMKS